MTNHITFDPLFDIVADHRGVYTVPSGCTPHHPDVTRLVFRNADFQFKLSREDQLAVACAADEGDIRSLRQLVARMFTRIGRATESGWI